MEDKSFLLIIAIPGILVLIALLNIIGMGEAFGINPVAHSCVGKKISREDIMKYFPVGEEEIKTPIYIKYSVLEQATAKTYCIGQNLGN
jgi:hypothetical protein